MKSRATTGQQVCLSVFPLIPRIGDHALLDADEHARMARLRRAGDRDRFLAAHAGLRRILGAVIGAAPAAVQFHHGRWGKPGVVGPVQFNLSHCDDLAAVIVAPFAVGIDIERVRPIEPEVARRFFAAEEVAGLECLSAADYLQSFYACWTRKEAFIKARGDGLNCPLDSFAVSLDHPARVRRVDGDPAEAACWHLHHFVPAPGLVGAIAARHPLDEITRRDLAWPSVPNAPPA